MTKTGLSAEEESLLTHYTTPAIDALAALRDAWRHADPANYPEVMNAIRAVRATLRTDHSRTLGIKVLRHGLDDQSADLLLSEAADPIEQFGAEKAKAATRFVGHVDGCAECSVVVRPGTHRLSDGAHAGLMFVALRLCSAGSNALNAAAAEAPPGFDLSKVGQS